MPAGRQHAADEESHPSIVPASVAGSAPYESDYSDTNVLIDAHEDRWAWRRRIRASPMKRVIYRAVVALAGLVLVALGLLTGPIPGPGGIPLVLLGLAVLASEFEWAHRLMRRLKAQLRRYQSWTRLQQVLFWIVFFLVCASCGYTFLLTMGIPSWLPTTADALLQRLPGL
ncbi:MAG TPA: PGPGW domain-containing protein [Propionibacteriaceae bacterium]|nr:PGPGW domain-containing protein [Propionibacteriaceae bacterium]